MIQVVSLYVRWWKTWKTFPVKPWVKAASYYRSGHFKEAENFYIEGLRKYVKHPARFSARLDLAFCFFKNRKYDEAREQLERVIVEEPRIKEAYVRLARLQMWLGHSVEAAWTLRRALQILQADGELVGLFILSALENYSTQQFVTEGLSHYRKLPLIEQSHPLLQLAIAKKDIIDDKVQRPWKPIHNLLTGELQTVEAMIYHAELLFKSEDLVQARHQLQRALSYRPDNPQVLYLLAKIYLAEGEIYNPSFALQLAQNSCQNSGWKNPKGLHVLADCYSHLGDKMSALLIASRAKDVSTSLLGSYSDGNKLEKMISELSSGSIG